MTLSVTEAKKKAAKTLTDDGLIDIFTGVGLILIGWFWLVDNSGISAVIPFALATAWKFSHTRISGPRTGSVTLTKESKKTIITGRLILGIIVFSLAIGIIAWLFGGAGDIHGTAYYPLFAAGPSLLLATYIFFSAKHMHCRRYYFYAGWIVASAGIAIYLEKGPATAFIFAGVPFMINGVWWLSKFLAANPLPKAK